MKRSSAWAVLEYLWYPALVFLSTPLFLRFLGAHAYGAWMFLAAAAALGTILSVGTGTAVIKEIAAARDPAGQHLVIRGGLVLAGLGGGTVCLSMAIFLGLFGHDVFARIGSREVLRLVAISAPLIALIDQVDNVFASALKGLEEFKACATIEVLAKSLQLALCMAAAYLGAGLEYLAAAMLFGAALRAALRAATLRRRVGRDRLARGIEGARMILRYSSWGWLHGIGSALFTVADRLIVGALFGAAGLAAYSIAAQLASQVHAITAAAGSVVFPAVSRRRRTHGASGVMAGAWQRIKRSVALASALALGLSLFGGQILDIWLGTAADGSIHQILPYLTLAYWILALNVIPHYTLLGAGNIRLIACLNLIAGTLSISALLLVQDAYGFTGAASSRVLYALVICCQLYYFFDLFKKAKDDFCCEGNRESQG